MTQFTLRSLAAIAIWSSNSDSSSYFMVLLSYNSNYAKLSLLSWFRYWLSLHFCVVLAQFSILLCYSHFYCAALNAGRSSREKGVCPSVWQTRELWQNGRKICPDFMPYERSFRL